MGLILEEATPKEAPEWFCGNADEWVLARRAVDGAGWSKLNRSAIPGAERRSKGLRANVPAFVEEDDGSLIMNAMILGGMAAGAVYGVFGVAESGPGMAGFGGGLGFLGALMGVAAGAASEWAAIRLESARKKRTAKEFARAEDERIEKLVGITSRAAYLLRIERAEDEVLLADRVAKGLDFMREASRSERRRIRGDVDESVRRVAERLRKESPEAFERKEGAIERPGTLEGKLTALGELGSDGLAAVALWRGMGDLTGAGEAERRSFLSSRIPRLLEAFESVPAESRGEAMRELNGETPEGSLRRGLSAALDAALRAKKEATERAALATEAEARVIEAAAGLEAAGRESLEGAARSGASRKKRRSP